jgi:hypothetical protein
MPAIKIANGATVTLKDVEIRNFDVGVQADGAASVIADGVTFQNVRQPWDIAGSGSARIKGTRIRNDPKAIKPTRKSSVGWTRPHGPPLPAYCPNCKSIFPSRNYNIGTPHFYSRDNEETCTSCGFERAKLSDGLFNLASKAVQVLSAPDFTIVMLVAVKAVADQILDDSLAPEAALKKLRSINPKFSRLAERAWKYGLSALTFLAAVASVSAGYLSYEQTHLSRQQLEISREQLELDKKDRLTSDALLEKALEILSGHRFTSNVVSKDVGASHAEDSSAAPSVSPPMDLHSQTPEDSDQLHHKPLSDHKAEE